MAVYVYRCADHGLLEVVRPIGSAPPTSSCPSCDADAVRVFTAPRLALGSARNRALLDRSARTADAPPVVAAPPGRAPSPRPAAASHPGLARLPRP